MKNKKTGKILSIFLALVMMMAIALPMHVSAATYEGSITVNKPAGLSIDGVTFTAYKIFSATYQIDPAFADFPAAAGYADATALALAIEGMKKESIELNALAAELYEYIKTEPSGLVAYSETATGTNVQSVTIDNNEDGIPLGYYIVLGSAKAPGQNNTEIVITAACSLTTADPDGETTPKVDAPTIDKDVSNHNKAGDDKWDKWTDVNIGDTVNFRITTAVPQRTGYEKYTFIIRDTMSAGLTFTTNSIVVKVGGATKELDVDYTVAYNVDGATFKITFDEDVFMTYTTDAAIEVTYDAVLNTNAIIAGTGNTNEVELEYSTNPYDEGTGKPPKSIVRVYTFKLDVFKYTGVLSGSATPVVGATFGLYTDEAKTQPVYFTFENGVYTVKKTAEDTATLTSPTNGSIVIKGLDARTYYLVELSTPSPYNLDDTVKEVVITKGTIDEDGTVAYTINNQAPVTIGARPGDINVLNNTGQLFPGTGGIGRYIVYGVGALLAVLLAAAFIFYKKRNALKV